MTQVAEGDVQMMADFDQPTRTWECRCGQTIERYRGDDDLQCSKCGQWFNSFGQMLRADWMDNPSNWDENIGDMEGYEISQWRRR